MAYKRKTKTTVTVTEEAKFQVTSVANNGASTVTEHECKVYESTDTIAPAVLMVEPTVVIAGPAGVETTLRVSGVAATSAEYSGKSEFSGYSIYSGSTYFSAVDSMLSGVLGYETGDFRGYSNLSELVEATITKVGDSTGVFKSAFSGTGFFSEDITHEWRNAGTELVCTHYGTDVYDLGFSMQGTIMDPSAIVTAKNEVSVTPANALEYTVNVAALPATDPHFSAEDTHAIPAYTGYWEYSAYSETSFSTLDTYVDYSGYVEDAGVIIVSDTSSDAKVEIPVIQHMPEDPGTVHPLHIHATNAKCFAPLTILPAIKESAKLYHPSDFETWTVQPNCGWISFRKAVDNGTGGYTISSLASDTVGCGTVSRAAMYSEYPIDAMQEKEPQLYATEMENQKVQFFMVIAPNTTGKLREAYPTISVGTKEYKITVKQEG